jgi:6-methylpretetramide 4-monooxygenase / 4-hydroxy-6-methylpretetramide 12a-monooxygenase
MERLERRWRELVEVVRDTAPAPSRALLVRPEGHIGYRAMPADADGLAALDTYLVPAST